MKPEPISATCEVPATPPGWRQFAKPSPWTGLRLDHMGASDSDISLAPLPGPVVAVVKASTCRAEMKVDGGRWRKVDTQPGAICFLPMGYAGATRWTGWIDSVSVSIDAAWLFGADDKLRDAVATRAPLQDVRDDSVSQLLDTMYQDNLEECPHGLAFAETLALQVLQRLTRHDCGASGHVGSGVDGKMPRALDFIHAFLDAPISVRDVADAADSTGDLYAFMRSFRHTCGKSPHQYILDARIERAKSMLLQGSVPLTTIAAACGFGSPSHFSDAFRKRVGSSPSTWRDAHHA